MGRLDKPTFGGKLDNSGLWLAFADPKRNLAKFVSGGNGRCEKNDFVLYQTTIARRFPRVGGPMLDPKTGRSTYSGIAWLWSEGDSYSHTTAEHVRGLTHALEGQGWLIVQSARAPDSFEEASKISDLVNGANLEADRMTEMGWHPIGNPGTYRRRQLPSALQLANKAMPSIAGLFELHGTFYTPGASGPLHYSDTWGNSAKDPAIQDVIWLSPGMVAICEQAIIFKKNGHGTYAKILGMLLSEVRK